MPEALISITTSWGPGAGSGNSAICNLRPPRKVTPCMVVLPECHDRMSSQALLHCRDRRHRRADGSRQAQRRRGQEKTRSLVIAQPGRQRGQVPKFAEVDSVLEQTMLMQRQDRTAIVRARGGGKGLDSIIVRDKNGEPAWSNPIHQPLVAAIERRAAVMQEFCIGPPLHSQNA